MTTIERVFHAMSFELLALALIVPLTALATDKEAPLLLAVGAGFSIFTTVWNYVYNYYFDLWFGAIRSARSLATRLAHTIGFEGGLVFITVPAMAWFLEITLWQSLTLEIGFFTFFFFYATGFNWVYDKLQPFKIVANRHTPRGRP